MLVSAFRIHGHNPNAQEQRQEGHKFKVNVVYITSSRPAELQGETVAKTRMLSLFMVDMLL